MGSSFCVIVTDQFADPTQLVLGPIQESLNCCHLGQFLLRYSDDRYQLDT
ncbi:MAG: hypothetical protein VX607_04765 [Planctomycetota bacterium]|nr:hypothetical protein [Planctomycetota bacterium]MEC9149166.1 hypothetical protein [Planctomycetota bacterium]